MADNQHNSATPKIQGVSPLSQLQAAMTSVYGLAGAIRWFSESAFYKDGEEQPDAAYIAESLAERAQSIGETIELVTRALQVGGAE